MTTTTHNTVTPTYVAIDIAKKHHAVLVETPDGKRQRFKMASSREDHDRLVDFLHTMPQPARIAFEPTADYHRTLAYRLVSEGFDVCLVSSIAAARHREICFNSWDKNDPKDAGVILALLKQGMTQRYYDPLVAGHHDLQELSKTYHQISLARTRLQHTFRTHYFPLYFPEIERYFHTSHTEWLTRFLERFPTAASIQAVDYDTFQAACWTLVGRKINKTRWLRELYDVAQASIGLPVADDCAAVETFRLQIRGYQALLPPQAELSEQAHALLSDNPDYGCLRSLPGIGPILALTILAEAGDLRRFGHHRQFLKFCGLDLSRCQSGQYRGQHTLSKRGNARLRYAFWMAATIAVRMRENTFRDKYERYIQPDPGHADRKRKALTAVAAKMARVAYALIKQQSTYCYYHESRLPSGKIPFSRAVGAP